MPRAWDSPSPTWVDGIFMSKSGELALELEKDLGISRYCLILALALEDPKTFREMQPIPHPPHTPSNGGILGPVGESLGLGGCHSVLI